MKKVIALLIALGLLLGAVSVNAETMVGGWSPVVQEAGKLPEDAQAAFDKALEQLDGAVYTPVALLSTQVVAGTNYLFVCEMKAFGGPATQTNVKIFKPLPGQGAAELIVVEK